LNARSNKGLHRLRRARRKANAETRTPAAMPREILERIDRVRDYHRASKHTYLSVRTNPHKPDWSNQPNPFRVFGDLPKVELPTDRIVAEAPALAVLSDGLSGLPPEQLHPPHDLRTLASWLHLANGITGERRVGKATYQLRSCPSSSALFPFELYVAAFAVDGLEPGLYHYSVLENALRQLRDGAVTLAKIKRGRPDLEFLKTVPAALLISTVFCRCSFRYRQRAYRYALTDAGHLVQNVVAAANGLGIQTTTRLRLNDRTTRELIGVEPNAPFGEAEAVHAMVVWAEQAREPMAPAGASNGSGPAPADRALPKVRRQPLAARIVPYGSIVAAHEDCVAPGVALRDLRPPLTELSPLPAGHAPAELTGPPAPSGGPSLWQVMMNRRSARDYERAAIPLEKLWQINRLAFRGGSYFPVLPNGPHVGLIRPMWVVNDVAGLEPGLWYYDPAGDHWALHRRGAARFEGEYLCLEQALCGNASAVCFMIADLKPLMARGGPDAYRLAHLEAGVVGQRIFLAAGALGVGCTGIGPFYDDEVIKFLEPEPSGWEVIYATVLGVPIEDDGTLQPPPPGREGQPGGP
jgi:SagB-type dehydrogenase family enzyme